MGVFSFVKAGKKIYGTIKSVKPALGKSKLKKAVDDVKLSSLKAKGKMKRSFQKMEEDIDPARKKLRQTTQKLKGEKVTESGVSKGKDLRENKMGGGMMGRRFGYSEGKLAVTPREKQLAAQYGDKKRITRGDVITAAKNKSGKRMQAKFGGGADTGKLGELKSKLGVVQNKIKRKTERLKKLKSARESLTGKRGADI